MADQDKSYSNVYYISFKIKGIEIGQYIKSFELKKNVTLTNIVEDKFVFDSLIPELLNAIYQDVNIEIKMKQSNALVPIYKSTGIISKVNRTPKNIEVYFESYSKIDFMRKNGVSLTMEHVTVSDFLKKYIEKFDSFYKHKKTTTFFYNYEKNINKFKYENLLAPIKNNHYETFTNLAKTYYLLNVPFYMFFDDYNFNDKEHPFAVNIYDITNVKSLRAVMLSDLNTTFKPTLDKTSGYTSNKIFYKVNRMQRFTNDLTSYSNLKYVGKLEPVNKFKYLTVTDDTSAAGGRLQAAKTFYEKSVMYFEYSIQDFDITKFTIGYRYVDDISKAQSQYLQAIVDLSVKFHAIAQNDYKERNDNLTPMMIEGKFKTISN